MSIQRFVAGTTSEALRKVRDTLGSEAVILSNRAIEEGIEILALAQADVAAMILRQPEGAAHAAKVTRDADEKPVEAPSRGSAGNWSPLADHASHGERLRQSAGNGIEKGIEKSTGKAAPGTFQIKEAHRTDGQPVTGDRQRIEEAGVARAADAREIFKALAEFKGSQAGNAVQDPPADKPAEDARTKDDAKAGKTARTARTGRTAGASRASKASAASSAPKVTELSNDTNAGIELAGAQNSGAGAGADSASIMKQKRLQRHSWRVAHPVAETTGKYASRFEKLREKRAPARAAARTHDIGERLQADTLRRVADEAAASVLREISAMRGTLEQQLTALSWSMQQRLDPVHGELVRQLLTAGFGGSLVHDLIGQLPAGIGEKEALSRAQGLLAGKLQAMENENEILEKGGIYALVGPTGVGKTTTTAKLAARCVLRHGADKVALLTTDGYRIGGHEQLRIYGKILGITVHAVRDQRDLALALAELRGRHIVLIDTVGMGQRDQMVAEQAAMLAGCGADIKRLVLLNAASNRHTLDEVAHAYCGNGLAGAIITKLDEAVVTGGALDIAIRHRLPLYYVTRGQRVPEDMELAHPESLVNGALESLPDVSGFAALEDEFAFSAGPREDHGIGHDMSEARLG